VSSTGPRYIGLALGIAIFMIVALLPELGGMSRDSQLTAAVTLLMAAWWLTEAVPVAATAMVPMVLFPLLGILNAAEVSAPYASKTNMLFLGGLMIATALERWNLHQRLALHVVQLFGSALSRLVLGFMVATAAISMWISNSATTMMMLPIALAVCKHIRDKDAAAGAELTPILMLAVAYSATIGGVGTIVGPPPNAVFVGAMAQLFPNAPEIGFLQWMLVGVPLVVVLIPITWLYLVRVASCLNRHDLASGSAVIRQQLLALGPMRRPEKRVLLLFIVTAGLWMFRRSLDLGVLVIPGWAELLPRPLAVGDSTVAISMALLLFIMPAGDEEGSRLLDWEAALRLPWGVILLLGGGFALAEAIRSSGLAADIGTALAWVGSAPPLLSIAVIAMTISLATEITTNTAITTIMMPVLAASALAGGCDPLLLMIPCTLAASLCFMMPSGTAPNAIVFSGGHLSVAFMARTGVGLNMIAVFVVIAIAYTIALPVFDITVGSLPSWAQALP